MSLDTHEISYHFCNQQGQYMQNYHFKNYRYYNNLLRPIKFTWVVKGSIFNVLRNLVGPKRVWVPKSTQFKYGKEEYLVLRQWLFQACDWG
jgi:hypothetical protein